MADAELRIGGVVYGGWESVGITRAMDAAAGAFRLTVTDRWSGQREPWPINPGDECEVRADGETVIRGWVDIVRPGFDAGSHAIEVQGRDRTGDMIDCSAVHDPDEWRRIDLLALANILGGPFGIGARAEVDVGAPIDLVKLNQGETALEALSRYAKARKVLVMPDGAGGVLLTRTGARRASVELVQGENILRASGSLDWSERFSDYIVKGQGRFNADNADGEPEAHVQAAARDTLVTRYRPLIVVADADAVESTAADRATWEANTRLGRSAQASVTVVGWRETPGGALWRPNTLVNVRSPWLRIDGQMLVRQVTLARDATSGTVATLELVSPQAYDPAPPDGKGRSLKKKDRANVWAEALGEEITEEQWRAAGNE